MTPTRDSGVARWRQLLSGSQMSGGQGHQGGRRKGRKKRSQMKWRVMDTSEYRQATISGTTMSHSTGEWGDKLMDKQEGICRIGLLNPSGLTLMGGSAKDDQIRSLLKQMDADVMCFPKVSVCWHKLTPCNRLEEQTLGWFETMHRLVAYNVRDRAAK
jgi:hypothetical protein